jgi:hypothetical protein
MRDHILRPQLIPHLLERRAILVEEPNSGTLLTKDAGDLGSDTRACSGNERGLAGHQLS